MCNDQRYTESGAPIAPTRCAEYIAIKEENARLREALTLVSAVVEGTESVPSAMGVAEYIVCLIGNATKEVG